MSNTLAAFSQVVLVDLVLAGDNAVVVGALAATLPPTQRRAAVVVGIGAAVLARIALSVSVVWLLAIPGVMFVGAALLLWVAWKMWRDLRSAEDVGAHSGAGAQAFHKAVWAILVADTSMSLDNVLGVAGAAGGNLLALGFGLLLSVVIMGAAASAIATVINKHRWIAYVGLGLIIFIAARMFWHGLSPALA